jgi:hypothetical protein
VIDLQIEPGEMIAPGRTDPVVVLSDTSRTRVRAFVEEIDAPRVTVGVQAKISADGIPNETFDAVVRTISPRMEPKRVATDRPNELYDSKVREVLLEVAPSKAATRLIVGLRVDVLIAIDSADGLQTTHVVESVVAP